MEQNNVEEVVSLILSETDKEILDSCSGELTETTMQYPLTPEECFSPEEVVDQEPLEKQKGKTYGRLSLQDPTHSGVGEEILKITVEKPYGYKTRLAELYHEYNEKLGWEAMGFDELEKYK